MSGVQVEQKESWESGGHFGTRNVQLACTLSTLGFELRGKQPLMLQYDGNRIHQALKRNDHGNILELASCNCVFAYETTHPNFGKLTCPQIERAYKLAELLQQRERGDVSPQLAARIADRKEWCESYNVSTNVILVVQTLLDQLCNWNVYCQTISDLSGDPFLHFSRDLQRGVHHALNPLNTEKTTMNRAEKFFKS